jgi:RHS repeat-associated protein
LEERLGSSTYAERQFVWGLRYVDDLVFRDRDTDADHTLDERLYALHDYFHPTAVADTSGTVQERYGYDAYGASRVMDASFGSRTPSSYDWETRFGDYRWDSETALYQVRFRHLHSKIGRWASRDPVQYLDGPNLYAYCGSNPLSFVDPFGLDGVAAPKGGSTPLTGGSIWPEGLPGLTLGLPPKPASWPPTVTDPSPIVFPPPPDPDPPCFDFPLIKGIPPNFNPGPNPKWKWLPPPPPGLIDFMVNKLQIFFPPEEYNQFPLPDYSVPPDATGPFIWGGGPKFKF